MSALIATVQRRPTTAFAAFLAVHFCLWTALPTILYPNLPLDLIEALTYGREWQLGYDKLPPLPWWLVEIVYRLVGHDVAYYALAQLSVIAAFAVVWMMARRLVGPVRALLAVLIIDGLHYFNYTAAKFNHDVIQLPLWAIAGYAYWRALRQGRLIDWIVLGASIGLGVWAKYFIVVLALPLALFVLADRRARRSFTTPGPYLAVLVALLIMSPHLVWLVENDFLPFGYAEARAAPVRGLIDHVVHPLQFVALQLGYLLPSLLIAAPLLLPVRWPAPPTAEDRAFDWRIVAVLSCGPAATVIVLSALTGRGTVAMWGYPIWLFLGVWYMLLARPVAAPVWIAASIRPWAEVLIARQAAARSGTAASIGLRPLITVGFAVMMIVNYVAGVCSIASIRPRIRVLSTRQAAGPSRLAVSTNLWTLVTVGFAVMFIVNYGVLPNYDDRHRAVLFPGEQLGREISMRFRAATGRVPLYVIGSMWTGGNVGHYAPDRPRVLIDGKPARAPWIDLADLRAKGAVVVWSLGFSGDPPGTQQMLLEFAPAAEVQRSFSIPARRGTGVVEIGWAIVRPQR